MRHSDRIKQIQTRLELDLNEDDHSSHYEMGLLLFDIGMYGKALYHFSRALDIYPEFKDAKFMLSYCLLKAAP